MTEQQWEACEVAWDRHTEWLREYDARCEKDRQDRLELYELAERACKKIEQYLKGEQK